MLLALYCYLTLGLIALVVVFSIHLVKAERQGYEAVDYWDYIVQEIDSEKLAVGFMKCLFMWPVRLIQFVAVIDVFYDVYDYWKSGPRTRKGWL